jgi:acetyltransferase-like isoleucine patch superfamily enzyme
VNRSWRRWAATFALVLLRGRARQEVVRRLAAWEVHPTARVRLSWIQAGSVSIGAGATIGMGNVIRGLRALRLAEHAEIGHLNTISGAPLGSPLFANSPHRTPDLVLGEHAAITTRHRLICSDAISFEPFATMGGNDSQIVTHGVDLVANVQRTAPVVVGYSSLLMTRVTVLAGATIPPRVLVAAGSVVTAAPMKELNLYGGVPAKPLKELDPALGFFTRAAGRVD